MNNKKIIILVSGSGSNMLEIIKATKDNYLENVEISLIISNNSNALAIEKAKDYNIETLILPSKNKDRKEYTLELMKIFDKYNPDLICLAGFLVILDKIIFKKYANKIINIHPSLLPKFGGIGMYGIKVHEAVLKAKKKFSGATVHFVTEEPDSGEIILQEKIDISDCKTSNEIAKKVLNIEHKIYKEAIKKVLYS